MKTLHELLSDLEARGRVGPGTLERARCHLAVHEERTPWYLTLLMGAGAWVATIFFLIGAGVLLDIGGGWGGWAVAALVFLGLGLGSRRFSEQVFVAQLSLGLSLAGWGAGVVAGGELLDAQFVGYVATGLLLAAVVYLLHPDVAPRFMVSLGAFGLLTLWLFVDFEDEAAIVRNVPVLLSVIGAGLLFMRPGTSRALLPLGHALALTLAITMPVLSVGIGPRHSVVPAWPAVLALTAGLALLVWRLASEAGPDLRRELLALGFAAVAALGFVCWFGGPGLLAAIFLLVLGHAAAQRAVEVLGLVALPVFLFLYYRDLHVPLLTKSGIVIASGLVLLLLRHLLARRFRAEEAA